MLCRIVHSQFIQDYRKVVDYPLVYVECLPRSAYENLLKRHVYGKGFLMADILKNTTMNNVESV